MNKELISIITPSYNSTNFIAETIESVLNQTYLNWELIIIDDFSTDNSVQIVEEYLKKDDRIKLIRLDHNSGAAKARNIGLENAKGRFITFIDSDDLWLKERLEKQLNFTLENNYAYTYSPYITITEDGKNEIKKVDVPISINYKEFLHKTTIALLTVFIDKEKVGEFKMPLIRVAEDMGMHLNILKRGIKAYSIGEYLAKVRIVQNSLSSNKLKQIKDVWTVYRKFEELSLLTSGYHLFLWGLNAVKKRL
jgi:teichuronic acid biosynthesis glycosyltransferase TuaG